MKNVVATIVAIVLGLISVFLVNSYIESRLGKKPVMVPIIVAAKDIKAGTSLTSDLLTERQVPRESLPPHPVKIEEKSLIIDKEILFPVKLGDPIEYTLFRTAETRVTQLIKVDRRAVALKVNPISSVAQQIRPEDFIDVYATVKIPADPVKVQGHVVFAPDARNPYTVETVLMLTKVKVISVDFRTNRKVVAGYQESELMGYGSITVEVTPEEAEVLIFTQSFAELTCTLRNPDDRGHPIEIAPVDLDLYKTMIEHIKKRRATGQ